MNQSNSTLTPTVALTSATQQTIPQWQGDSSPSFVKKTQGANESLVATIQRQIVPRRILSSTQQSNTIADYQLIGELGRGQMATVYVAKQTSINRPVALKVLNRELQVDESHRLRFLQEVLQLGRLDHRNIIPVYDMGMDCDGGFFYTMKRVKGASWSRIVSSNSFDQNLGILLKVANAISYAHGTGVIHRDLNPSNVMVDYSGEVYVIDWGIAVSQSMLDDPWYAEATEVTGTPCYMPPEMAQGWPLFRITPHVDIYMLGAILFELICGHPPHFGNTPEECVQSASRNEIFKLQADSGLADVAFRAMSTRPADRYTSVCEFERAIRSHLKPANHRDNQLIAPPIIPPRTSSPNRSSVLDVVMKHVANFR